MRLRKVEDALSKTTELLGLRVLYTAHSSVMALQLVIPVALAALHHCLMLPRSAGGQLKFASLPIVLSAPWDSISRIRSFHDSEGEVKGLIISCK